MNPFRPRTLILALSMTLCLAGLARADQQTFAAGQLTLAVNQTVDLNGLTLAYQDDGNLVAYAAGQAVWASGTWGKCKSSCLAAFQTDGNLVLYSAHKPYWATNTYDHPEALLVVSTASPYLEILSSGTELWPTPGPATTAPAPVAPSPECPTHACYFIDAAGGSDSNDGASPATAWRSVANLSRVALTPGTSILLKRGTQLTGQQITLRSSGTAANPIVVDAYGSGAAPILSGGTYGILGQSISHISIANLSFQNTSDTAILGAGNGTEYWTVTNCVIANVGTSGIQARPDWNNAAPLHGWFLQSNTIGTVNTPATLNYDKAGILLQGTDGAMVLNNNVAAVNTSGIRVGSYQSAPSINTTIGYNEVTLNQGGIAVRDTPNALITHNWIHDGKGFAIGISGNVDSQGRSTSYNNVLTYNLAQNMIRSDDGLLYNGFDINSSAAGQIYHNTIENVNAHSITLEGDITPSNYWIVRNNILDARRQGPSEDDNPFLFRLVDYNTETLSNNLWMSNSNWPGLIGTDMDASTDLAIWFQPAWLALGIDHNSLYNQDPAFANVAGENLSLGPTSPARGLALRIAQINQQTLDAGALPFGQTSVLNF